MRTLLRRRPSPAMIVALVALVVASASTAVAATVITSSRDIKDGVILSRDIHRNTINGDRIQDGSLGVVDFGVDTRAALRGPRGRPGERGPAGPRGRRGATGSTVLSVIDYNTARVSLGPGATQTADVSCTQGLEPVGGGFRDPSGKLYFRASAPKRSLHGWSVRASNLDGAAAHPVVVYVICARARRVN
jgi:hypothetical protein